MGAYDGPDRLVRLDPYTEVDPAQVDALSYYRGVVTIHMRSGRSVTLPVGTKDEDGAVRSIHDALWPPEGAD